MYIISPFTQKTVFLIMFSLLVTYGFSQHGNDEAVLYSGGEIYKLMQYEEDDEITRIPYGKIRYISYDKFYKSFILAFRNQSSPPNSSYSMNFEYIGEVEVFDKKYPSYKLLDTGVKYFAGMKTNTLGDLIELVFSPLPEQNVPHVVYHLTGFKKS